MDNQYMIGGIPYSVDHIFNQRTKGLYCADAIQKKIEAVRYPGHAPGRPPMQMAAHGQGS